jgi:hypothetical protein
MRYAISCKLDLLIFEQEYPDEIPKGVVLDLYFVGDAVRDFVVLDYFHEILIVAAAQL